MELWRQRDGEGDDILSPFAEFVRDGAKYTLLKEMKEKMCRQYLLDLLDKSKSFQGQHQRSAQQGTSQEPMSARVPNLLG